MSIRLKPVHVTDKALIYTSNNRANLRHHEIVSLVQENRLVYLGSTDIDFMLAWDWRKSVPVVLLVARHEIQDTVISIWEPHYKGIPNGQPTEAQIEQARRLAPEVSPD
ncbi:MAG: hypothetical protein KBC62_04075 [Candidatus Pacebacteria bacterium]|jgi:hypothetical protein|nr:hypothetical protein [Candidatus Paceibacterota bacterium]